MQFATAGNAEYISVGSIFNTQGNVGQQFFLQAVADLAGSHEFAFSTGQRRSIDHKVHGQGRLVHAQHRQAFRIVFVGNGYADTDVFDTGNNHDIAGFSFFQRYAFQALEAQQLVDAALGNLFFMIHHGNNLAGFDAAVQDAADTEAAGIVVVVQLGNLELQRFVRAAAWCRRVFQNGLEQRTHIAALVVLIQFGKAGQAGSIDDREVQLFVGCAQVVEQFECLVDNPAWTGRRFVDFVDNNDRFQTQSQGFFGHETGLRHRAFLCVNQQYDAVNHAQYTFHFATKIGVSRGIYDVDVVAFVFDGGIFSENGNAAFFFKIVAVHDAFFDLLVGTECTGLAQQLVN